MKLFKLITTLLFALPVAPNSAAQSQLPQCVGKDAKRWTNCQGVHNFTNGDRYEGEFLNGRFHSWGAYYYLANNQYRDDKYVEQLFNGARPRCAPASYLSAPEPARK